MLSFEEFKQSKPLFEGIDIDVHKKIVKFNDNHEDYVDTGLLTNPSSKDNVISIFKRKHSDELNVDGNPLVHALKGKYNWKISETDKKAIWDRIEAVLRKIENMYDVVILSPSTNSFVSIFGDKIKNVLHIPIIEHCLVKITKEEIQDASPWKDFSDEELIKVEKALSKMDYWFESKYFPKNLAEKLTYNIVKEDPSFKDMEMITDKRVLIIDDVISSGWSLRSCENIIKEHYFPKSVTLLTMFSKVQK